MIQETKIMKESSVYKKFCDVCGTEIRIGLACSKAVCSYCKKDLCNKCVEHEESSFGDYRGPLWCKQCWEIGDEYRPKIEQLGIERDKLYEEWQAKCKQSTPPFPRR